MNEKTAGSEKATCGSVRIGRAKSFGIEARQKGMVALGTMTPTGG
jgi:hypothetical protein